MGMGALLTDLTKVLETLADVECDRLKLSQAARIFAKIQSMQRAAADIEEILSH